MFLTINNKRQGLVIETRDRRFRGAGLVIYPPLTDAQILEQLQPGEISLIFLGASGWFTDVETVGADVHSLSTASLVKPSANSDLSQVGFSFNKHGKRWSVSGFLREPISAEDRLRIFSIIESLRFADVPVANAQWAENLAGLHLPSAIHDIKDKPTLTVGDAHSGPSVTPFARKMGNGYTVVFTLNVVPPNLVSSYKTDDTWVFFFRRTAKPPCRAGRSFPPR